MNKFIVSLFGIAVLIAVYFYFFRNNNLIVDKNDNVKIEQSIAVLPFVNMSSETGQEYFGDGLAEGILNSLAHLKGLKVAARTSSFNFRGKEIDSHEIGKKLNVRTILEGSYQLRGDSVRITVQLINTEDQYHFWSEQFDESTDNVFTLQDKIANAIAEKLQIVLMEEYRTRKKHIPGKEAYDLYLQGRACWNLRTPPNLIKGIDFYHKALELDTMYAAAYAGVADCYAYLGYQSHFAPKVVFPKAKEAALKALELDSTLAEPYSTLGFYEFYYDWDWAAAEQEFRTAFALNPNYELGYDWYGYFLTAMERYEEAVVILKRANELDPLSAPITTDMGFSLYYSGNYDKAIGELTASKAMNPKLALTFLWLGRTYQAKKMYAEAIAEYKNALEANPDWPVALAAIGNVYGVSGDRKSARETLETMISLSTKKFVTSYGMALVYCGLGEKEQTFHWLNKAYEERSNWLVWLKTDPRWEPIHSEIQYVQLVNAVGLPHISQ